MGPDVALRMVWDILNETYFTPLSPSQQLLKKLVQGPIIRTNDSSAIFKLSIQCRSAQKLHQAYSDVIPSIQDRGTLEAIVNRLDDALRLKWAEHRKTLQNPQVPTFNQFVMWIKDRADATRWACLDRDADQCLLTQTYADVAQTTTLLTGSATQSSMPIHQKPVQKVKQATPGGDKEYRDTTRKRQRLSKAPSVSSDRSSHASSSKLPQRRSSAPKMPPKEAKAGNALYKAGQASYATFTSEYPECLWCTENGKAHNHTTSDCAMFKNIDAMEQWTILFKNRACNKCLELVHYRKECSRKNRQCAICSIPHHQHIGCRPANFYASYYS